MRRLLLLFTISFFIAGTVSAQSSPQFEEPSQPENDRSHFESRQWKKPKKSAITIWSEDFANGIPSTWVNQGYDQDPGTGGLTPNPLCVWEYRGPNTTPDNTTGSRGQYAGSGPTISSPTSSNGFLIFDSDYLDSDGISGNRGNGVSPTPHIGTLSTDTIDLTGYPYVQVVLVSRARKFQSRYKLAVSNDGGVTFPDTVEFHPNLAVNSTNSSGEEVNADITNTAGGQSMVVLQLIYEGNANDGLYYWQLDDMEIRDIPAHAVQFTEWNGAPANDVIYPSGSPKYGNPQVAEAEPITFDSNILNFGVLDQTNVRLVVDVVDLATGNVVTTLQSPAKALLASGDTGTYVDFTTTGSWTPSAVGEYRVYFTIESDSIPSNGVSGIDSVDIDVNDLQHGGHFDTYNNDIGSEQSRIALAQAYTFPNEWPNQGTGEVWIDGVWIRFSSDTDPDGQVIVEVYDTAGFTYGSGGGPAGNPYAIKSLVLDTGLVGTWAYVDMTTNGNPLILPEGTGVYVVVNLIPTPTNIIQIGNDQNFLQSAPYIAMQRDDGTWFSRYTNSRSFSNLLMEVQLSPPASLEELHKVNNMFTVFPQPADGELNLEFLQGGSFELTLTSYGGVEVYSESIAVNAGEVITRNFDKLSKGVYLLRMSDGKNSSVKKVILK